MTVVVMTIAWTTDIVRAENAAPIGVFSGGGYQVIVDLGGRYISCDPRDRQLVLGTTDERSYRGKTHEWQRRGYIYRITGVGNSLAGANTGADPEGIHDSSEYRQVVLTIVNSRGRKIVYQILNNPSFGADRQMAQIPLRCE